MPARRSPAAGRKVYNIVHLIYRSRHYEGHSKDYEFSPLTMEDHWRAGDIFSMLLVGLEF
jgi:NTE family protein